MAVKRVGKLAFQMVDYWVVLMVASKVGLMAFRMVVC